MTAMLPTEFHFSETEKVIRACMGACRQSIRPLVRAVDLTASALFTKNISIDDFQLNDDVYAYMIDQPKAQKRTIARSIQRLTMSCWDKGHLDELDKIIGKNLTIMPTPREMLIYFAFYAYLKKPFYSVVKSSSDAV